MKILYDARVLKKEGSGGVALFLMRLLEFLSKKKDIKISLICRRGIDKNYASFFKDFSIINVDTETAGINLQNIKLEQEIFPEIVKRERPDIYHAPFNWGCGHQIQCKKIQTIHDLIPLKINEDMTEDQFGLYETQIKKSAKAADKIITVSRHTKKDVIKKLNITHKKIKVIYNGLDKDTKEKTPSAELIKKIGGSKYFIHIGGLYKRKNIPMVLKSFKKFIKEYPDFKLVITGAISGNEYVKNQYKKYNQEVVQLGIKNNIIFTDYISREELIFLIKKSVALLYPSLDEGFGLPVLEGMLLEIPVITSKKTVLEEIAKDAAIKVDPESENDLLKAMQDICQDEDLRTDLIKKGRKRIKIFSWEKMGEQYFQVYKNLLRK